MKLLLVGAGYVGLAFLKHLGKEFCEIFITTTDENKVQMLKAYGHHVIMIDSLEEATSVCDAMIILVAPHKNSTYEETYLNTAKRVVKSLQGRTKPFYIIYTSSTSVCEGIEGEWIFEDTKLCPKSDNAKILLETEKVYLDSGADVCVLRMGGIYGPGRELEARALRLVGKQMQGSGEEYTNHIHLEDIVKALEFFLEHHLKGVYYLVNDAHPTRKELYGEGPIWSYKNNGLGYKVSNQKIKEAGFVFSHPNLQ